MVDFLRDAFYSILRLVTKGRYSVTNGDIFLASFRRALFLRLSHLLGYRDILAESESKASLGDARVKLITTNYF